MKVRVALDIVGKEIGRLQGGSPQFYIALGFLLAYLEYELRGRAEGIQEVGVGIEEITLEPEK